MHFAYLLDNKTIQDSAQLIYGCTHPGVEGIKDDFLPQARIAL
jgi:hypothetical protein